jgi:hypothetical protein
MEDDTVDIEYFNAQQSKLIRERCLSEARQWLSRDPEEDFTSKDVVECAHRFFEFVQDGKV